MGVGYDTVNLVLLGQISFSTLALILIAKSLATACAAGLGIPGGLIGANLFMGACAGSVSGRFPSERYPLRIFNLSPIDDCSWLRL